VTNNELATRGVETSSPAEFCVLKVQQQLTGVSQTKEKSLGMLRFLLLFGKVQSANLLQFKNALQVSHDLN
jgi:hypothetical protein